MFFTTQLKVIEVMLIVFFFDNNGEIGSELDVTPKTCTKLDKIYLTIIFFKYEIASSTGV